MRRLTSALFCGILVISLSACSGRYRYACQDPANWKIEKCVPPACEYSGVCSKDLVKGLSNE